MSDYSPITPPPKLVRDWARYQNGQDPEALWFRIATLAARWGAGQELQPVAVSERLPGDALSWWYEPDEDEDDGYGGMWTLLRIRGGTTRYTHWLPANALPTPETNV